MSKPRWLFASLAAGLCALLIACGGDDGGKNDSNSSAGTSDSPTTTLASSSSGSGSSSSSELDLTNATNDLLELRSFRFDMGLKMDFDLSDLQTGEEEDEFGAAFAQAFLALFSDIKMKGSYVAPDSFDLIMTLAGEDVHVIQIGNEAWVNDGNGWQVSEPGEDLGIFSSPTDALDVLPKEVLTNAKTSKEKVNGVDTTRYSFDEQALRQAIIDSGEDLSQLEDIEEAKLDVWVTEDNLPVKVAMTAKGKAEDGSAIDMTIDFAISDLNSNDIKIQRPI